ncbi:hypothetical protein CCH79_00015323 [Gambusia affinis]|uniref:Uncharacterized protein n=1 Tax=Gambusia affinis TaxID=33528 RepID=A0A315W547_GAMAF|nr:hypothetical protein CCH79_00015323 [Gambusia affinis]
MTETLADFLPTVSRHMNMGPKLETGCTEGEDLQFITFRDKKHATEVPRLTSKTVMMNDYRSPTFMQGNERLPGVCSCSCRETGYTRGANPLLVDPRLHLPSLELKCRIPVVKATGNREPSGFCLNMPNEIFSKGPLDPSHFTTHYNNKEIFNMTRITLLYSFCYGRPKDRNTFNISSIVNTTHTKNNGYNKRNTDSLSQLLSLFSSLATSLLPGLTDFHELSSPFPNQKYILAYFRRFLDGIVVIGK